MWNRQEVVSTLKSCFTLLAVWKVPVDARSPNIEMGWAKKKKNMTKCKK